MAVEKVLGIETEYGITGGPDSDPVAASTHLVNAFAHFGQRFINWDFNDETPGIDARGRQLLTSVAPIVETQMANTVLTNGARFYVDHAHPEYSAPECRTPREAVLYDLAGEEVLRRAMAVANEFAPDAPPTVVYKNNSDHKGNSYGTHENYLLSRDIPFDDIVAAMVPHFVSRQIVVGAGKVGVETEDALVSPVGFQLSGRAEFFEEVVGLETTLKRPIVNTRDEPHANPDRYRRLHVIIGDANMSHVATLVKLGSTAILLAILEDWGAQLFPAMPKNPVSAVRLFSRDVSLKQAVDCIDGVSRTSYDLQDQLWLLARRYVDESGAAAVAPLEEVEEILRHWREMLDGVKQGGDSVIDRVDWVAKRRILNGYAQRYGLDDDDPKLRAIDLQYHDIRPEKSLAYRSALVELFSGAEILRATQQPPIDTRAYFRGRCVAQYPDTLVSANWDSVIFDHGGDVLQRIPMMEPLRGTELLTRGLFDSCETSYDLVEALRGERTNDAGA